MEKAENGRFAGVDYKGTPQTWGVFHTRHERQLLEVQMASG
jgi:hypothetical protein